MRPLVRVGLALLLAATSACEHGLGSEGTKYNAVLFSNQPLPYTDSRNWGAPGERLSIRIDAVTLQVAGDRVELRTEGTARIVHYPSGSEAVSGHSTVTGGWSEVADTVAADFVGGTIYGLNVLGVERLRGTRASDTLHMVGYRSGSPAMWITFVR